MPKKNKTAEILEAERRHLELLRTVRQLMLQAKGKKAKAYLTGVFDGMRFAKSPDKSLLLDCIAQDMDEGNMGANVDTAIEELTDEKDWD